MASVANAGDYLINLLPLKRAIREKSNGSFY